MLPNANKCKDMTKKSSLNVLYLMEVSVHLHKRFMIFHLLQFSCCGCSPQSGFKMEVFTYLLWSYDANHLSTHMI